MQAYIVRRLSSLRRAMASIFHLWWTNRRAAEERFALVLKEPLADKVFTEDWAKRVADSIDRQRKTLVALIVASVVPTGYLALSLMEVETKTSVAGLEITDQATLFGVALLATCLLGLYGARVAIFSAQSEQLLSIWLTHKYASRAPFYELAFGPSLFVPPRFTRPPGSLRPGPVASAGQILARVLFAVATWALAIVVFMVQVWAVRAAITTPDCPAKWGGVVCTPHIWREILGYVGLALTVANVLVYFLYGLAYRHREQSKRVP
jgi:hypothetical protein